MKPSAILKIGYMPRWFIASMDAVLSFFSILLSYLLRFNFETKKIDKYKFIVAIVATLIVYLTCFFIFRSFKEIIRHTTFKGVLKIFQSVFTASAALLCINLAFFKGDYLVPISSICINFFISFCLLGGSRTAIKNVFEIAATTKKQPVILFGAGDMGKAALNTIMLDNFSNWRVVGIVDDDIYKLHKKISGVSIYNIKNINGVIKRNSVTRVIIAVNNISLERRNEVAELFIEKGLTVSVLPHNQQWLEDPFKLRRLRDIKIEDLLQREPIQINNTAISNALKNKCILVTGAAGSIGSEIAKQVAAFEPSMLLLCDMAESPLHEVGLYMHENTSIKYKLILGSITQADYMEQIFSLYKPDIVFHAAAYKHVPLMEDHPREAILNNIYGTKIIADFSLKYKVSRFVMVPTDKAVNPTNVMGASKRIAEMYIQSLCTTGSTLFITTRFGNVLDSNGSVIPRFRSQLAKGGPITITHPEITRFFMTIPEACQLVLEAGVMGKGTEIFVFDMGQSVRIKDLAYKMIILAGLKPGEDIKIQYTGLRPREKLYEEVLNDAEITSETYHPKIRIARARHVSIDFIQPYLANLINNIKHDSDWECVRNMKVLVPEFISNNSKFEELDKLPDKEQVLSDI